ncbi:venom carboxylesterase-6-like [Cimex lectularius]|uniref:Carboxylic ester hydrolase n=1 Tax=Cimex lectularius TaxID=79782 RepID=A0A8I6RED0_CIMLE|nr:venom carboxylesterase-6-like [Cimex lectularius]
MVKFFLLCLFLTTILCSWADSSPEVAVLQGKVLGKYIETISGRKIAAFLGIPYAEPPVGNLRFREPVPSKPWPGLLNATSVPNDCLQYSHYYYKMDDPVYGSEDCLYLNVYVPESPNVHKTNSLPVLINIHSGAFMFLSGSTSGPEYLLDHNVILVTMNYRLGILGFLSTEDDILPGNNGLKDQNLALKWVYDNIKAFGGDPGEITLSGLSAGAASTHYHILSSRSKGLFKRAIILSGSALCHWAQTENSKGKAETIANEMGCPVYDTEKMVDCLRNRPGKQIVQLTKLFMPWLYNPFTPFGPVIEHNRNNAFIDKLPSYLIRNKMVNDVPILFSLTEDEGLYPGAEILAYPKEVEYLNDNWETVLPHLLDFNFTTHINKQSAVSKIIRNEYFGAYRVQDKKKALIEMIGDRVFKVPVSLTALYHAKYLSSDVYTIQFSYLGKTGLQERFNLSRDVYSGTSHADDLFYVLRAEDVNFDHIKESLEMSKRMVNLWMTFITGKPFKKKLLPLKKTLPDYSYLKVKSANPMDDEFITDPNYGRIRFWRKVNFHEDSRYNFIERPHDEL